MRTITGEWSTEKIGLHFKLGQNTEGELMRNPKKKPQGT